MSTTILDQFAVVYVVSRVLYIVVVAGLLIAMYRYLKR